LSKALNGIEANDEKAVS